MLMPKISILISFTIFSLFFTSGFSTYAVVAAAMLLSSGEVECSSPVADPSSTVFTAGISELDLDAFASSSSNDILHERIGERQSPERQLSAFGLGEPRALRRMSTPHPSHLVTTVPLSAFAIDFNDKAIAHDEAEKEIAVTFDHRAEERSGSRWRSHHRFEHGGTFTVKIKTPEGNTSGLNTSFYLSSLEGDKSQDEIDFEFLGKDKWIIQTNYYTAGKGNREQIHNLGFDSSLDFHEYTIRWLLPSSIEWLVDGNVIRRSEISSVDDAFPVRPMYLYASIWNAGDINGGDWAGPYSGAHVPYVTKYRNVHVPAIASAV